MSHIPIDKHQDDGQTDRKMPNPEVVVKAQRRRFTAEYKHRILEEADACTHRGDVGALLRREGLYSSHLSTWHRQRQQGELQGLTPAKRGRKGDPLAAENARLQRKTERLTHRPTPAYGRGHGQAQLARAELIIDVQKKVSELLGLPEIPLDEIK
jgi:transposase